MFISLLLSLIVFFQFYPAQTGIFHNETQQNLGYLPVEEVVQENLPTKVWENNSVGIKTTARSVLVIDKESQKILFEKDSRERLPIASLTKLMTALVFLDYNPGWDEVVEMKWTDNVGGATLKIGSGEKLTVKDLFYTSLIGSFNNGIMALARSTGLTEQEFVFEMNRKAAFLGLADTNFVDPTGLDPQNISTAYDVAIFTAQAFNQPETQEALLLENYTFQTVNTRRKLTVQNTDKLLNSFLSGQENGYQILGGKTGYLVEAGYCLVTETSNAGNNIITVILGSESLDSRFQEMKGLVVWTFENYTW